MLKMVAVDGAFRKVGDTFDIKDELANMLIRTGVAKETKEAPKKSKK